MKVIKFSTPDQGKVMYLSVLIIRMNHKISSCVWNQGGYNIVLSLNGHHIQPHKMAVIHQEITYLQEARR